MLVLSRRVGESVVANTDNDYIGVHVVEIRGDKVRLGFNCPKALMQHIRRSEILVHSLKLEFEEKGLAPDEVKKNVMQTLSGILPQEELRKLTRDWS